MLRPAIAALSLAITASAADAAVYRYDVTMELSNLELYTGGFWGTGTVPEGIVGPNCSHDSFYDAFVCDIGFVDLTLDRFQIEGLEEFTPLLMASLVLDTEIRPGEGFIPTCTGAFFICREVNQLDQNSVYSASMDGFYLQNSYSYLNKSVSSAGALLQNSRLRHDFPLPR